MANETKLTDAQKAARETQAQIDQLSGGTSFQKGKYEVDNMMYPSDLMGNGNQYGGNYVIFYVNVHEDSYLVQSGKVQTVDGRASPRLQSEASGVSAGGVHAAGIAEGAAASQAAGAGEKVVNALGGNLKGGIPATVANVAAGGLTAEAAIMAVGGAKKEYKQMKSAIALHIPNELSVRYSASWDAESMGATMALAQGAGSENLGKAAGNVPPGVSETSAGQAARGYLAGLALKTPGAGSLLSKTSGRAANPKKEQLFQEVDFRTFNFNYQFFPRSPEEAANIQRIIKTFKLHMHPEYMKNTGQFLYIYPSEFDIVYYQNGKENMNLHRHTSCVLTDMQISYTGQGQFNAFADGMPVQINVNLTFKELALLTKETIDIGY